MHKKLLALFCVLTLFVPHAGAQDGLYQWKSVDNKHLIDLIKEGYKLVGFSTSGDKDEADAFGFERTYILQREDSVFQCQEHALTTGIGTPNRQTTNLIGCTVFSWHHTWNPIVTKKTAIIRLQLNPLPPLYPLHIAAIEVSH